MARKDRQKEEQTKLLERTKTPRKFQVIAHNDDYTTMDFVILVFTRFFQKNVTEATRLMLQVHRSGLAVVGVYSRDIAETKVDQVIQFAEKNGHPFVLTTKPE